MDKDSEQTSFRAPGKKTLLVIMSVLVGLAALGGIFAAAASATDQPSFCGSACHEMGPYHVAWANGPHRNVACVECHVDAGAGVIACMI
jgi:hypothetical protein